MAQCNAISVTECNRKCKEAWEVTGYYRDMPGGTEKRIVAMKTSGVCARCFVRFVIHKEKGFQEVSCEEFYLFIEKTNAGCGNCVKTAILNAQ